MVDGRNCALTFGSAAAASVRPWYEDWLNDLSSMPPVSVTMQALNLAAVLAGALLDAPLDGLLPDELEPHAAASMATTLATATIPSFPLTGLPPLPGAAGQPPRRAAGLIAKP